jgi:hypothetical protein
MTPEVKALTSPLTEIIWGGTFLLSKKNGIITYKTTEEFYPLK